MQGRFPLSGPKKSSAAGGIPSECVIFADSHVPANNPGRPYVSLLMKEDSIKILGARVHNLKNVDLEIPRRKLVVITGLSGSGKSSLAFDTIYAEGQRSYMETLDRKSVV